MIKDYHGNLYTQAELMKRKIKGMHINIKDTEAVTNRLERLEAVFEKTEEYKNGQARLEAFYEELKQHLPKGKHRLVMTLDDLYMELLIINEEYFYKKGYIDGKSSDGFICRLKEWLSKKLFRSIDFVQKSKTAGGLTEKNE